MRRAEIILRHRPPLARPGGARRGSVLIIVVALLAVMGLLVITLGYTTRIDTLATRNWVHGVQARMAAASELPMLAATAEAQASAALAGATLNEEGTHRLAPLPIQLNLAASSADGRGATVVRPLADIRLHDTAARFNINAIIASEPGDGDDNGAGALTEADLGRLIAGVIQAHGLSVQTPPALLARRIVARRGVTRRADARPGALTDTRLAAAGDRIYTHLGELMEIDGMTSELYRALEPHLTTFSVSHAAFELPGQADATGSAVMGWPQLDPNTAPPELIHATVRRRFPQAAPELVGQFVANLAARRDGRPVELTLEGRAYRGLAVTPYISEVFTNNIGFLGVNQAYNDGQFVELHNPFRGTTLSIEGWVLAGAGPDIVLSGSIPPGGFLVVTDDFNNANDPTRRETPASFFTTFGVVATGPARVILERRSLDLPGGEGKVKLRDDQGRLVDVFSYDPERRTPTPKSFQRIDPRLDLARLETPTPLSVNRGLGEEELRRLRFALDALEDHHGKPLRSALDVMLIDTSHLIPAREGEPSRLYPWQLPELKAEDPHQLDVRLVDCFRIGVRTPEAPAARNPARTDRSVPGGWIEAPSPPPGDVLHGLINLNTAPIGVLAALPGIDERLARAAQRSRDLDLGDRAGAPSQTERLSSALWWREVDPQKARHWRNLSDFLIDDRVWGEASLYERLDEVWDLAPFVTTHSMSLLAVSISRVELGGDTARRPALSRVERLLAGDRGRVETVSFRHLAGAGLGDPDHRAAAPVTRAGRLLYRPGRLAEDLARRYDAK